MADKARHAFGMLENIDSALSSKAIDAYDILFVKDADGKPYVGWIDKDGNKVIVDDSAEIAALEKALATKVDATHVDTTVDKAVTDGIASANAYTDKMVEAAMGEHLTKKFEITDVPDGTLIDYRENEIRVMCKSDAVFTKQSVGAGGDANNYYMTFKTYAPDGAVGYTERLGNQVDVEILTDLKTDEYGRKYQLTWLALAKYDESTGEWNYYGKNSTVSKYVGWDYQINFYDDNGVMIASDCVRINLSNEDCHSVIKPYYVGAMMTEMEIKLEEKIKEVESSYEVIEF